MSILNELEKKVSSNLEASYYYQIEKQVNEISKILKEIRLKEQIPQIQIARQTGLSKQMISKIECYNGNPTLTTLVKYCNCVGIDLVELLQQHSEKTV